MKIRRRFVGKLSFSPLDPGNTPENPQGKEPEMIFIFQEIISEEEGCPMGNNTVYYAAASIRGKEREYNNDRLVIDHDVLTNISEKRTSFSGTVELPCLAAVCDGVGKTKEGGIAADAVVRALSTVTVSDYSVDSDVFIKLLKINYHLIAANEGKTYSTFASTVSILQLEHDGFTVFHLGDSRIYKLGSDGFSLLTRDHTVDGRLSRYLGMEPQCLRPLINTGDYSEGDLFLLCTDGVYRNMHDFQMASILYDKSVPLETRCDRLLSIAAERSRDDMSVLIIDTAP